MNPAPEIRLGDIAVMRKPHVCGSPEWEIVRLGADIGVRCLGCRRRVLLPRPRFLQKLRQIKPAGGQAKHPDASAD